MNANKKISNTNDNSNTKYNVNHGLPLTKSINYPNEYINYKIKELVIFNKKYSWIKTFKYIYEYDDESKLNYVIDKINLNKPLKPMDFYIMERLTKTTGYKYDSKNFNQIKYSEIDSSFKFEFNNSNLEQQEKYAKMAFNNKNEFNRNEFFVDFILFFFSKTFIKENGFEIYYFFERLNLFINNIEETTEFLEKCVNNYISFTRDKQEKYQNIIARRDKWFEENIFINEKDSEQPNFNKEKNTANNFNNETIIKYREMIMINNIKKLLNNDSDIEYMKDFDFFYKDLINLGCNNLTEKDAKIYYSRLEKTDVDFYKRMLKRHLLTSKFLRLNADKKNMNNSMNINNINLSYIKNHLLNKKVKRNEQINCYENLENNENNEIKFNNSNKKIKYDNNSFDINNNSINVNTNDDKDKTKNSTNNMSDNFNIVEVKENSNKSSKVKSINNTESEINPGYNISKTDNIEENNYKIDISHWANKMKDMDKIINNKSDEESESSSESEQVYFYNYNDGNSQNYKRRNVYNIPRYNEKNKKEIILQYPEIIQDLNNDKINQNIPAFIYNKYTNDIYLYDFDNNNQLFYFKVNVPNIEFIINDFGHIFSIYDLLKMKFSDEHKIYFLFLRGIKIFSIQMNIFEPDYIIYLLEEKLINLNCDIDMDYELNGENYEKLSTYIEKGKTYYENNNILKDNINKEKSNENKIIEQNTGNISSVKENHLNEEPLLSNLEDFNKLQKISTEICRDKKLRNLLKKNKNSKYKHIYQYSIKNAKYGFKNDYRIAVEQLLREKKVRMISPRYIKFDVKLRDCKHYSSLQNELFQLYNDKYPDIVIENNYEIIFDKNGYFKL